MWLPYFCNTTNIRLSRMEIHETGYAWRFIRTSSRAIREPHDAHVTQGASMTLVGLLPPLSDNGDMLVDGGYRALRCSLTCTAAYRHSAVDNLPVPTMLSMGVNTVFAVDVGSVRAAKHAKPGA